MAALWVAAFWMAAPWMAAPDLESLQNSLKRNWILRQPLLFTYWLPKHPDFWFTPLFSTQSARPPLVIYPWLCSTCVTYETPCHTIGHQVLPIIAFNVIPHPFVSYCQVFRPILYFQPSLSQSDSRLYPNPYLGKQRISLGAAIILSMYLCSHT